MKLLILCAVLSVVLAVSSASPARTQIRDVSDSSSSSEEKVEEKVNVKNNIINDNSEEDNSSEENSKKKYVLVDLDDDEILDIKNLADRSKRSYDIENNSHSNNHIIVKDEGSIKFDKYLKLKRLRRDLEDFQDFSPRFGRSADTSEENSSEEDKKAKKPAAQPNEAGHEHSEAPAGKPDTAPAESIALAVKPDTAPAETLQLSAKPDTAPAESEPKPQEEHAARRRRSLEVSSEETHSDQEQEANEIFIYSNEKQEASEENFKNNQLKKNEYVVLSDKDLERLDKLQENKTSDEDYAQGCGGSTGNQDEDSNEDNETTYNSQ